MFVIGVTGGIGCGKSTVARIASDMGVPVLDADALSHEATAADGRALPDILEAFGPRALSPDGSMNRKWIASLAFRDKQALDRVSGIIHRHVLDMMGEQIRQQEEAGTKALLLDVPIPVKNGFLDVCNQVWVVWADDAIRMHRLRLRGMSEDDIRRRMAMQMTRDEYLELADVTVLNNGTEAELEEQVRERLSYELKIRGIRQQTKTDEDGPD